MWRYSTTEISNDIAAQTKRNIRKNAYATTELRSTIVIDRC